jgi:hypothetical protein
LHNAEHYVAARLQFAPRSFSAQIHRQKKMIDLRFAASAGRDPLFRASDTADRPGADLSNFENRRAAFDLML